MATKRKTPPKGSDAAWNYHHRKATAAKSRANMGLKPKQYKRYRLAVKAYQSHSMKKG